MRRVRYQVACSLDGFIAEPDGGFGWITPEPSFDFEAHWAQFGTLIMGRNTYAVALAGEESFPGKQVLVASRTLRPEDHPAVEVIQEGLEERIRELRSEDGGDIWLYGGGQLFSQVLAWDLVDTVEPAVVPILLGDGIPMLPSPAVRRRLRLVGHRAYPSGLMMLEYAVERRTLTRENTFSPPPARVCPTRRPWSVLSAGRGHPADPPNRERPVNRIPARCASLLPLIAILLALVPLPAAAQGSPAHYAAAFERMRVNVLAMVDSMPEAGLRTAPTDGVRDFAEQIEHVALGNVNLIASGFDADRVPLGLDREVYLEDREELKRFVDVAFDRVREMLDAMTPADLAAEGMLFGQIPLPKWQIVEAAYEHGLWTLGATVPYVRLQGGVPHSYGIVP